MEEQNKISKSDASKEVLIRLKKINALSIILIVAPFIVFAAGSNIYLAGIFILATALIGGWFFQKTKKEIKYLQTKYNIR